MNKRQRVKATSLLTGLSLIDLLEVTAAFTAMVARVTKKYQRPRRTVRGRAAR